MVIVGNNSNNDARSPLEVGDEVGASAPISTSAPWLLANKVTTPARTTFFVDRPQLLVQLERTRVRVVVVQAPAGFGKTTMLAEVWRRAKDRGERAAWLTVDEDDTEDGVGMYLMYAFERAGLVMTATPDAVEYRMDLLAQEIERHAEPTLIVVDELERLSGAAVEAVNFFLQHAPRNLRIVLGLRHDPGLDLSSLLLEKPGTVLGADQLRFSTSEINDFFGGSVSRREMTTVAELTEGWPVAVCLYRYIWTQQEKSGTGARRMPNLAGDDELVANWLGARLLRDMSADNRDFLFDLGLFDWIDAQMVDDVLDRSDSARKLNTISELEGLIQPLEGGTGGWRLHPLLKDYCSKQRLRESPKRYRALHRKIAVAMLDAGDLVAAVRHAGESGDNELVGNVLIAAGGLRLWFREGGVRLAAAARFLTPEVADRYPRLALLRCLLLVQQSRLVESRDLYAEVKTQTRDFQRDRSDGDVGALGLEGIMVGAMLSGYGCMPLRYELTEQLVACFEALKLDEGADSATVAVLGLMVFAGHHMRARFEDGRKFGEEAEEHYALSESHYGALHMALHFGIVAMVQGRVAEAEEHYRLATSIAERHFPLHPEVLQSAHVLVAEVDLECNRMDQVRKWATKIPLPLRNSAAWLDVYIAAHEVIVEWRFEVGGVDQALQTIDSASTFAISQGLLSVVRHLSALRAHYLLAAGRVEVARDVWHEANLPDGNAGVLDLDNQSWREMESIALVRIRMLYETGRRDDARELAGRLSALADERGLTRTLMRSLALRMALEHRAGNTGLALERLSEFLDRLPGTGYSRPLMRERRASQEMLQRLLEAGAEPTLRSRADALLGQLETAGIPQGPRFTTRERQVLECVAGGLRDKEVARRLGLTVHGVRFHLNNIFRKTGATGRTDAVLRARAAGEDI